MNEPYRFYGELARWWPLISPADDYAEESAEAARLLRMASIPVRSVLELGSGGGHSAYHLKHSFSMTLSDLSAEMLAISAELNPECVHHVGDMRTLRLGETFDGVFIHDAVDYMLSGDDLRQAFATAYAHCRPGGVAVVCPDHLAENFSPETDCDGNDGADGRGVRYLNWSHGPYVGDGDSTIHTEYAFVFREPDGRVFSAHETHVTGLFPKATWVALLREAGFAPEAVTEDTTEDREPRVLFVAHRSRDRAPAYSVPRRATGSRGSPSRLFRF